MKTLRVFTAFSGYESQCLALNLLGIKYRLVGWSEIDKYAIRAHDALFPKSAKKNFGDISKIDWRKVPDFDLFTYSSPCQDFSQAGKQRGAEKGSGTRSSLLWECERAIETKRPKYLVFENVAAVVSSKFIKLFNEWQLTLERLGYTNFVQVLNAKTHGYPAPVPQNRERLFMVSILDCQDGFYFPQKQNLTTRLKDVLEKEVDEKYYLKDERIQGLRISTAKEENRGNRFAFVPKTGNDIAFTIKISEGSRKTDTFINVAGRMSEQQSGALTPALTRNTESSLRQIGKDYRIRKLTPRESFRLMGVQEPDIDTLLSAGISNSQLYKLAGNSIVVNCLAAIFKQLFIGNDNKNQQLTIF